MIPAYQLMQLSSKTLDNIDVASFDFEGDAAFLICKAFEWGTVEDLCEVWAYYGDEKTKEALLNATVLRRETLYLAATIFNSKIQEFRSYQPEYFKASRNIDERDYDFSHGGP